MLELVRLVEATLAAALRSRRRLDVENLLLRQQLQVALRSQRRPRLQARDKLFWLLVRRLHRDWRRHLLLVRPETVPSWHRRLSLAERWTSQSAVTHVDAIACATGSDRRPARDDARYQLSCCSKAQTPASCHRFNAPHGLRQLDQAAQEYSWSNPPRRS